MSILDRRYVYKPFEYPRAYDFFSKQQNAHWGQGEVAMTKDIKDWQYELTDGERRVVGQILKSFTQTEIHVNDYWAKEVREWFPKPEIAMMCSAFSNMEAIHTDAYAYLNDSLGIDEWEEFLKDPTAVAKLDRLKDIRSGTIADKARSLAIFSACTEGVNLFSSFAVLASFSRFDLLNGVETIVGWSSRDEALHSSAGCWLFNTIIEENPEVFTDDFKKELYDAFRLTVQLEDDYVDNAFSLGDVRGLHPEDIKVFIRARANDKLVELGLKPNWTDLDSKALSRMEWFNEIDLKNTDFFAKTVVDYFKSGFNVDNLFQNLDLDMVI